MVKEEGSYGLMLPGVRGRRPELKPHVWLIFQDGASTYVCHYETQEITPEEHPPWLKSNAIVEHSLAFPVVMNKRFPS